MGIFGGFNGGLFNNNLQFNPGLTPGQVVPSNPAFNPTPLLNSFFQPFPWAANSLMTSTQIALAGGGTPLIASMPGFSPFSNPFLNLFNPALSAGLGGVVPGAPQQQQLGAGLGVGTGVGNGVGTGANGLPAPIGGAGGTGNGALAGLGGLLGMIG